MRTLRTDGPLAVEWFNPQTVGMLEAQVWGQGFEAPLFCDEVAHRSLGLDALAGAPSLGSPTWGYDSFGDQPVQRTGPIEWNEARNRLAMIGHRHLLAITDGVEVAAEMVS